MTLGIIWPNSFAIFGDVDLRSAILLAILSFIIDPVLPEQSVGPYGLVQLLEAWATVLLIAALGFVRFTERPFAVLFTKPPRKL